MLAVLVMSSPASAQRNKFDGLRQCERLASAQMRKSNPQFRRFVIDRSSVSEDKYADQIGTQFVSTIYHGKATYEASTGPRPARFICLHGGVGQNAAFVYTMPD